MAAVAHTELPAFRDPSALDHLVIFLIAFLQHFQVVAKDLTLGCADFRYEFLKLRKCRLLFLLIDFVPLLGSLSAPARQVLFGIAICDFGNLPSLYISQKRCCTVRFILSHELSK